MTVETEIAPLKIANEAFMIAATIERCPRAMMLRELVMNALEAASEATDAEKRVRIDGTTVAGVPKLRILNTGRGLAADELLQITDLSSSLFKTVGLDGNFGMGAKAASLTSNRYGLRYRSCRKGRVSEVTLGERGGIYGRLRTRGPDGALVEVSDVTAEAGHPLDHDWTEVVLLGNAADQDTTRDPYAGNPGVSADWVMETLARRFFRLPEGVVLEIATGSTTGPFVPPLHAGNFDRYETVAAEGGITLHYGFMEEASARPQTPVAIRGLGAVIADGEIYALTEGRRFLLEAPTYGFTFAARRCTVLVELPKGFAARPEQYRQFLRFTEGDQHQVTIADFGELVRRNIPPWLQQVIEAMRPEAEDYLSEISSDLKTLLEELGLDDSLWREPPPPTDALQDEEEDEEDEARNEDDPESADESEEEFTDEDEAEEAPLEDDPELEEEDEDDLAFLDESEDEPEPEPLAAAPRSEEEPPQEPEEPPKSFHPPEIIVIDDEEQIAEKDLGGRAARYYPDRCQLFVNARYEPFLRLAAQLADEFSAAADPETIRHLSRQAAEWALVRRLARTLVHSLAKARSGWRAEDVKAVQSPEALSLLVDDFEAQLPPARLRMAIILGLGMAEGATEAALPGRASDGQRNAALLAEAEALLQRAVAANAPNLGPYYRRVAHLYLRQGDHAAARTWIDKGIEFAPDDPWCYAERADLLLREKDLDGAVAAAVTRPPGVASSAA